MGVIYPAPSPLTRVLVDASLPLLVLALIPQHTRQILVSVSGCSLPITILQSEFLSMHLLRLLVLALLPQHQRQIVQASLPSTISLSPSVC